MKATFLSDWAGVLPHHVTQMGAVLDAEMVPLCPEGVNSILSQMEDGWYSDVIVMVTRMVNKPSSVVQAQRLASAVLEDQRCETKLVLLDIEGLAYLELAHLRDGSLPNPPSLAEYLWLANRVHLNISMSRSSDGLIRSMAPKVSCRLFGFIPEPDEVYDGCYRVRKGFMTHPYVINIGIGAKAGPARRGLTDVLTAIEIGRRLGKAVNIHIPFGSGEHLYLYNALIKNSEPRVTASFVPFDGEYGTFLRRLVEYDLVVNLDPIDGASRLASECARVGVPCLGMRHSYYQELFFPYLSVDVADPYVAARQYCEALRASRISRYLEHAREISNEHNREASTRKWKSLLREIGVPI